MEFPVDGLAREFAELLPKTDLVLSAPTGSGKSTRVPLWCRQITGGRVLVVEPRRVACRTLAGWVASGLGQSPGETVGYAVRFESRSGPETAIEFVTPGVALGYATEGRLPNYSTILVDEFHERGLQTDLFLALTRRLAPHARLVVMSATLEAGVLSNRLGARWLNGEGRVHPVDLMHLGEVDVPSGRRLPERVTRAVRRALAETQGNVLVFLPGMRAITECASRLSGVEVVRLHGSFSHKEQDRAFAPGPRRVILSTNVAESSVTVPGVTAVVDSGLVKQHIHRGGHSALVTVPVSLASAEQRRGRAGRVCPGVCYRLWSEHGKLESATPPELMRIELTELLVWIAAAGLTVEELDFVDPPPEFALARARRRLLGWGVLKSDGTLSEQGLAASRLPLPIELARLLAQAPGELAPDLADLCAVLEGRSSLFANLRRLPRDELEQVVSVREKELGASPPLQGVLALRVGDPGRHRLNADALGECRRVAEQLRQLCGARPLRGDDCRPDAREVARYLLRHWPERAYLKRKRREAWGNGQSEVVLPRDTSLREGTQAAIMLSIEPVGERGLKTQLVARNPLPVSFGMLAEAGIGTPVVDRAVLEAGRILAEVSLVHAGRELGRSREEVSGEALRQALADLVLRGKLLPGAGRRLEREVAAWNLKRALDGQSQEPVVARDWLLGRLEALGVQEQEDWPLLGVEDLAFEGLSAWELEQLEGNYPAEFSCGSARFAVEYDATRRRVVLHWRSGHKNTPVSATLLPRWNGWRVQIEERGRVTTVRQ